nr:MAG TPA: hypothetical protein [Bacteriophage sp.]
MKNPLVRGLKGCIKCAQKLVKKVCVGKEYQLDCLILFLFRKRSNIGFPKKSNQ